MILTDYLLFKAKKKNTSSKIDLKSAQDFSMMHIIKILPTLKAISASCDPILMNLGLF